MDIVFQMLGSRGYELGERLDDGILFKRGVHRIFVSSIISDSIQVKFIDMFVKILQLYNINHGIAIYKNAVSSSVRSKIESMDTKLELLNMNQLSCNIMDHYLQPRFIRCDSAQAIEAKKLYIYPMPIISREDATVLWMGWGVGDIISICEKKCQNSLDYKGQCCIDCRHRRVL